MPTAAVPANDYSALTYQNTSRLKRFSHGTRYRLATALVRALPGQQVLDVGTGDAYFPRLLVAERPGVDVVGYDPDAGQASRARAACVGVRGVVVTDTLPVRPLEGYAWVTCFEVLEHFTPRMQLTLLQQIRAQVGQRGRVVVSVPLEIGVPGLAKNLARAMLRQRHAAGWSAYLRAAIGMPAYRTPDETGYIPSHVGFDHRALRTLCAAAGFSVERTVYSPIPVLGWLVNSQVFWVLRPEGR